MSGSVTNNVFFRSVITVEKPSTSAQKVSFLCTSENWPRYKDKFSCNRCLKLRPSGAFADKQIKAKRGKGHAESDRRFCLECGVKKKGSISWGRKLLLIGTLTIFAPCAGNCAD